MERTAYLGAIEQAFKTFPLVAVLGPRQCGKTTLARVHFARTVLKEQSLTNYFDLEDPEALQRLAQPKLALEELRGLVVIDEIQRQPELFPILRVLADRPDRPASFLILGSASRELIRQSSESLAGRIRYMELTPFSLEEVGVGNSKTLWLRGGYPRAFLAESDQQSFLWLESYIRTFLERDIPQLGINISSNELRRFWMMLAHNHAQILNISELGRAFGVSETVIRRYLDILSGTFMIRLLQPWQENIAKRQVKRPKVFIRDSGLLHRLYGYSSVADLDVSPKRGASWEGFVLEELIRINSAAPDEAFFWSVHQQAELDLLIVKNGKKIGFEVKHVDAPRLDPSMEAARDLLKLDSLTVIYPGKQRYKLAEKVEACGLSEFLAHQTK